MPLADARPEHLPAHPRRPALERARRVLLALLLTAATLTATVTEAAAESPVTRLAGDTRIHTAATAATATWQRADHVLVSTGYNYPDALAAAAYASVVDAPILLTDPAELSPPTAQAIRDLGATRATILGGAGAVQNKVESQLRGLGLQVERIEGVNRYATAVALARSAANGSRPPVIALALGDRADGRDAWPDALAASSLAGLDVPVPTLLTARAALSPETREALLDLRPDEVVILGGPGAVPEEIEAELVGLGFRVERAAGASRYGTAVDIADAAMSGIHGDVGTIDVSSAVFVSGVDFPDALAAGAVAARLQAPLLLVPDGRLADRVDEFIRRSDTPIQEGIIIGGTAAVSDFVASEVAAAIEGIARPAPEPECPPNSSPDCQYTYRHPIETWERLADCESGQRWDINTGNGYYGGLQFSLSTWRGVGGTGYPHEHSKWEQIHRGEILQQRSGWGQWPHCSRKLGLR